MSGKGGQGLLKVLNDYFLAFVLAAMAAAGLAGWLVRGSIGYAFLWGLYPLGAVVVFFILWGPLSAVLESMEGLRADAAQRGWAAALARAWALGLVSWVPPHALIGQFLLTWLVVLIAFGLGVAPRFMTWHSDAQAAAVAGFIVLAGVINGAFRGAGR